MPLQGFKFAVSYGYQILNLDTRNHKFGIHWDTENTTLFMADISVKILETPDFSDFSGKVQDAYLHVQKAVSPAPLTNLENPPLVQYLMKHETATKKFLNP